jgi:AraC family transcriptional regulator of adaptative response/methylated-DNA-[protein]-cysteine methyltransferase
VCWLGFVDGRRGPGLDELRGQWPLARLTEDPGVTRPIAEAVFAGERPPVPLLLRGTNFQIKVWEALLTIPPGTVVTYGDVAGAIGRPTAVRAVGHAVGSNPLSVIIPCHRVILRSGVVHNYRWGVHRKRALLALEAGRLQAAG